VVSAVERPVNVLARPGAPTVAELAGLGVSRISVGGAFAFNAIGALVEAAGEFRDQGSYGFLARAGAGGRAARDAFA
jgi:2-methylisocitrate lyase-like PEP mutase family enzyme